MAHKILVVDEQPFMVRLIQHHLERAGYELIKASTAEEAQEAMNSGSPQLVVMGESVSSQSTPTPPVSPKDNHPIPVIRMTDIPATMPEQKEKSETEIIFRKPFSPLRLIETVKKLMPSEGSQS